MASKLFEVGTLCYVKTAAWDRFYNRCPDACNIAKPHQMMLAKVADIVGNKFVLHGIPYYWAENELVTKDGKTSSLNPIAKDDDFSNNDIKVIPPKQLMMKYEFEIEKWINETFECEALGSDIAMRTFVEWVVKDSILDNIDACSKYGPEKIESLHVLVDRKVRQMGYISAVPKAVVTLKLAAYSDPGTGARIMRPFETLNKDERYTFMQSFGLSKDDFECDDYKIIDYDVKIELEDEKNSNK